MTAEDLHAVFRHSAKPKKRSLAGAVQPRHCSKSAAHPRKGRQYCVSVSGSIETENTSRIPSVSTLSSTLNWSKHEKGSDPYPTNLRQQLPQYHWLNRHRNVLLPFAAEYKSALLLPPCRRVERSGLRQTSGAELSCRSPPLADTCVVIVALGRCAALVLVFTGWLNVETLRDHECRSSPIPPHTATPQPSPHPTPHTPHLTPHTPRPTPHSTPSHSTPNNLPHPTPPCASVAPVTRAS